MDASTLGDTETQLLRKLLNQGVPGFGIPSYDWIGFDYYGSTNNIKTIIYKSGGESGQIQGLLNLRYLGGGASDDDKLIGIIKG